MKKSLLLLSLTFLTCSVFSQYVYQIKADSVRIHNDSCKAELILENSTKNINGFLYNKGNGRTEFRKALVKINDSTYLIGIDTLKCNNLQINSNSYIQNQYQFAQLASGWINGRFKVSGLLSADSVFALKQNASDYSNAVNGWMYYNSTLSRFRVNQNGAWANVTTDGNGAFIQNQAVQQNPGNFYISGSGTLAGTLTASNFKTYSAGTVNELSFSFTRSSNTTGVTIGRNVYSQGPIFVVRHSTNYVAEAPDNSAMAVFDVNGKNVAIMGSNNIYSKTAVRINASSMVNTNSGGGPYNMTGVYITATNNLQTIYQSPYLADTYAYGLRVSAINNDSGYWRHPAVAIQADAGQTVLKDIFNASSNPGKFLVIQNDTLKHLTTTQMRAYIGADASGMTYGNATGSGDGYVTTFTIAHSLAGITSSSKIFVTSRSADAAGIKWVDIDGTNIIIHYSSPPPMGTGNLKWDWEIKP